MAQLKDNWKPGQPIPASFLQQMARWINNLEARSPLQIDYCESAILFGLNSANGAVGVPIKITGLHASSPASGAANPCAYLGDIYAAGPDVAATATGVTVLPLYRFAKPILLRPGAWLMGFPVEGISWIKSNGATLTETVYFAQFDWSQALWVTVGAQITADYYDCTVAAQNDVVAYDAVIQIGNYLAGLASSYVGKTAIAYRNGFYDAATKDLLYGIVPLEFLVKADSSDTVPGTLDAKLLAGAGLTKAVAGAGNRQLTITAAVTKSIVIVSNNFELSGDEASPADGKYYGVSGTVKGWSIPAGDHKVMASSDDPTPNYLDGKVAKSIVITSEKLELDGDAASPGARSFYGVGTGTARGYNALTQVTVVVDVQYDASTGYLQKKTRTVYAFDPGTESAWTNWTGGDTGTCVT